MSTWHIPPSPMPSAAGAPTFVDQSIRDKIKHVRVGPAFLYLSIVSESTSDWGHDYGFGLAYGYEGVRRHVAN